MQAITRLFPGASTWIASGWFAWDALVWKASVIAEATRAAVRDPAPDLGSLREHVVEQTEVPS